MIFIIKYFFILVSYQTIIRIHEIGSFKLALHFLVLFVIAFFINFQKKNWRQYFWSVLNFQSRDVSTKVLEYFVLLATFKT